MSNVVSFNKAGVSDDKPITSIERMLDTMVVCEDNSPFSAEDLRAKWLILESAKVQALDWLQENFKEGDVYYFSFVCPKGDILDISSEALMTEVEMIYLPFGSFSMNVWNKLREDKKNPLFTMLMFFEFQVRGIRNILAMHGVSPFDYITEDLLKEHGIQDAYGLYAFENIYKDVSEYIS